LHKIVSRSGYCSLRQAERLIASGHVTVNGVVVSTLGATAKAHRDLIKVDNQTIFLRGTQDNIWILYWKPRGQKSVPNFQNEDSVSKYSLRAVSALPEYGSGMEILMSEKRWINLLCHPRHGHFSEHSIAVEGRVTEADVLGLLEFMNNDVPLDQPKHEIISFEFDKKINRTLIYFNLQKLSAGFVISILEKMGFKTVSLKRHSIGSVNLRGMKVGDWRNLFSREIAGLKRMIFKMPK
jgi:23S rRNA pseudouridine2605 synthase